MILRPKFTGFALAIALAFAVSGTVLPARASASGDITVFAAASLKTALDDIVTAWRQRGGERVRVSYAGSSRLAQQITHGAPGDVFISANARWMDVLEAAGHVEAASRRDLLENRLVLIGHGKGLPPVALTRQLDLAGRLGDNRLAMAMVEAVPAGIYGRAALVSLGLWEKVAAKVAQVDNVRAALALVERGEAPLGIVYQTDAMAGDNVTVLGLFAPETHPRIVYPAALVAGRANNAIARRFLDFLASAPARARFEHHGFKVIVPKPSNSTGGAG